MEWLTGQLPDFKHCLYYSLYNFMDYVSRKAVIFDGDDYSEPTPKDLIIKKPTPPPSPGGLGKCSASLDVGGGGWCGG